MLKPQTDTRAPLPCFGLHKASDGVWYLHQDITLDGAQFVGLKGGNPDGKVNHLKGKCSHAIPPGAGLREPARPHWDKFRAYMADPLVNALLPLPRPQSAYYLATPDNLDLSVLLRCLERLSSPVYSWVRPLWSVTAAQLKSQLVLTNLHPMVLYGGTMDDSQKIQQSLELAQVYSRPLLLVGSSFQVLPPGVERVETKLQECDVQTLVGLPLEQIGSYLIRRYCQGVELDHDL
ncbi:hypothetical protein PU634_10550 [Oceanimonas pelagia]|uniref:Uncharacterized protein n=1 Tax=Oceanimonas pelagia TaxID=3028314 RepID=A0AA50KK04_9GAMM|nr:hypothetical protein [Oceanimonas pelagia]WMC09556.1 hypothetical protein PU634_10550 [Oceanimonas pelagia]